MKRGAKRQYTVRSVPSDLDHALRAQAKRQGKSLNEVVLDALRRGVGLDGHERRFHDLDACIGTWQEDSAFDEALKQQSE